jgi:hypothetical protein
MQRDALFRPVGFFRGLTIEEGSREREFQYFGPFLKKPNIGPLVVGKQRVPIISDIRKCLNSFQALTNHQVDLRIRLTLESHALLEENV